LKLAKEQRRAALSCDGQARLAMALQAIFSFDELEDIKILKQKTHLSCIWACIMDKNIAVAASLGLGTGDAEIVKTSLKPLTTRRIYA
jgi:hypothetical protein